MIQPASQNLSSRFLLFLCLAHDLEAVLLKWQKPLEDGGCMIGRPSSGCLPGKPPSLVKMRSANYVKM